MVRELLLCGAVSPNSKLFTQSRKLDHPLFTAVENHCLQLVEVLLEYGASTSAANKEGKCSQLFSYSIRLCITRADC